MRPSFGCIVLTEGRRPEELKRALESLRGQRDVDVDIIVVGNGWKPEGLPPGTRSLELSENLGVPGGRNAGVPQVEGDLLLFLDDDARFRDDDALLRIGRMFAADKPLGAVSLHLVDPEGRPEPRYWVPRLRVGDRTRSSDATVVSEGAVVVRRSAFEEVGGWPGHFFYLHEGIDLAWRLLDAGYRVWYAGNIVALHPAPAGPRSDGFYYMTSRNRVWVARRNLPLPVAAAHVSLWFLRTATSLRSRREAQDALRGYRDGLRRPAGERRPVSWGTIWRMTRAGRPPIV
jgi:GT2 family glycosyltransferase